MGKQGSALRQSQNRVALNSLHCEEFEEHLVKR